MRLVVVDLGCGRGRDVLRAAGRVGAIGLAIGVDLNEAMLQKARESVPVILENVRFVRSDLAALELEDAVADVVVSNCTINHAPDKVRFFKVFRQGNRPLSAELGVKGSPTLLFFRGGREASPRLTRLTGDDIKRTALRQAAGSLLQPPSGVEG